MANVSMKALLEAGVHFGHRTRRWNPKMKPYIFTERNGIHIIDLQQTLKAISQAADTVRDLVARGGVVVFVGTKRQAQDSIRQEAERCRMPYVTQRWLGGTLTNFVTIKGRIAAMKRLEERKERGELDVLPKKETVTLERELERLHRRFNGLRNLDRIPDMLFVVDVHREEIAIAEANRLRVGVIGMTDTNSDPDPIDIVIPSNDDAIRAIGLMASLIADAALEGHQAREAASAAAEETEEGREPIEYDEDEEPLEPVFVPEFEIEDDDIAEEIELDLEEDLDLDDDDEDDEDDDGDDGDDGYEEM